MLSALRFLAMLTLMGPLTLAAAAPTPLVSVDLATDAGLTSVNGQWRYSDTTIVTTEFRSPDSSGQPTGPVTQSYDVAPHAGRAEFDDSGWPVIEPATLGLRRGHGRLSFNWYRLRLTVPEQILGIATSGQQLELQVTLDDYAEVWVDGEIARPFGVAGANVVAGWNAPNRVVLTRRARPGQTIQIAIFGMNGPISDTPSNFIYVREARLDLLPGGPAPLAVPVQEVNVEVVRLDPAIDALVPQNAKLYKLAEGFLFTEGPVWSRSQHALLFSDPNANTIYQYSDSNQLSVFREHSGYDATDIGEYGQPGSNGLTFDGQGRLTINEHGRHRVTRLEQNGAVTVLADSYQGRRLNSPNDLVIKSDGGVYFTDPPFGLPKFYDDPRKQLPYSGVYSWRAGKLRLLSTELKGPNGLAFSPDEKFLYVDNWDPQRKVVLRFPVKGDGTLGKSTVFADLTAEVAGEEALDGLKVDVHGNVFLAAPDGIRIYGANGKHLGTVRTPRPAHNFAWGGDDGKTLYITARSTLYRLPLTTSGRQP